MPQFTYRRHTLRLEAVLGSTEPMYNALTCKTPVAWNAVDWRVDFGFFLGGSMVGVSGLSSLTLQLKPFDNPGGAPVLAQTIDDSAIDNSTTLDDWKSLDKQHAQFLVSRTHTALDLGAGNSERMFYAVLTGITNDVPSQLVVLGMTYLRVVEGYGEPGTSPPPGDPGYYTKPEADSQFVHSVGASAPLASSGGRNPVISVAPGTAVGECLVWNGSAWVAGAALYAIRCQTTGLMVPIFCEVNPTSNRREIKLGDPI